MNQNLEKTGRSIIGGECNIWCKDTACYSCVVHISLCGLTESRYSMLTLLILMYSAELWWRQRHQSPAALMWWLPPRWPFELPGELLSQSCTDLSSRHMDASLIKYNFRAENPCLIRIGGWGGGGGVHAVPCTLLHVFYELFIASAIRQRQTVNRNTGWHEVSTPRLLSWQ